MYKKLINYKSISVKVILLIICDKLIFVIQGLLYETLFIHVCEVCWLTGTVQKNTREPGSYPEPLTMIL